MDISSKRTSFRLPLSFSLLYRSTSFSKSHYFGLGFWKNLYMKKEKEILSPRRKDGQSFSNFGYFTPQTIDTENTLLVLSHSISDKKRQELFCISRKLSHLPILFSKITSEAQNSLPPYSYKSTT